MTGDFDFGEGWSVSPSSFVGLQFAVLIFTVISIVDMKGQRGSCSFCPGSGFLKAVTGWW